MVASIINPSTNKSSSLMEQSPYTVIRNNPNSFVSVSIVAIDDKISQIVMLTTTGFQLRFQSRVKRELLDKFFAKVVK